MTHYLFFTTPTCGICKQIMESDLWETKEDKIEVVDATEKTDVVNQYNVKSFPTMIELDGDGNVQQMQQGTSVREMVKGV